MLTVVSRLISLIILLYGLHSGLASDELPCHFLDSVNITAGIRQSDESILFEGVAYPKQKYFSVDYILKDGKEKITVHAHLRGCTCDITPCLRLCCPPGTLMKKQNGTSVCEIFESAKNFKGQILNEHNETESIIFDDHFAFVHGKPCKLLFFENDYQVNQKGHVLRENNRTHNHHDYCFHYKFDSDTEDYELRPLICYEEPDSNGLLTTIFPICMAVSVFFIIATLLVYISVPKLQNFQGKMLIPYLFALAVGYTFIANLQFNGNQYVRPHICQPVGFIALFSFLSAFLWLNVMNFDFWLNFRTSSWLKQLSDGEKFFLYGLYGWGLPALLTFIVFALDKTDLIPSHLRPGIGSTSCFVNKDNIFVYFYIPLGLIFTLNIVFFALTALKICQLQREIAIKRSMGETPRNQNALSNKRDNFILYLRLFLVMGIAWSMEVISLISNSPYFFLTDLCNSLQGVFIFILFVMTRRTLGLIRERWYDCTRQNDALDSPSNSVSATYVRLNQMPTT